MFYLSETIKKTLLSNLRNSLVALVCALGIAGVSMASALSVADGGWDWSAKAVEEFSEGLGAEGSKVENRSASSSVGSQPFDLDHFSAVVSDFAPFLLPVFELAFAALPQIASDVIFGAHSATSPPARI
ncbi:MAG: hypothetical protein EBU49_05595 [Proteobacteria bacterium]|nr:hypothetical protein [Pseudomonadota bacterium]